MIEVGRYDHAATREFQFIQNMRDTLTFSNGVKLHAAKFNEGKMFSRHPLLRRIGEF